MHARRALLYWRQAMTVSTVVDHNDYTGNGVTTSFPYTFRIFKKTDLTVSVIDLSENITVLVLDTDYTVTNAGGYNGGSVVLTTPLANGWQISIARELEPTQETDLRNQGKFFAEVHEDAFDKLTMLIQQVGSMFRLALRKPTSIANWYDALNNYIRNLKDPRDPQDAATKNYVDTLANSNLSRTLRTPEQIPSLPGIELRKNKIVGFDSLGNPVVLTPESGSAADVLLDLADYAPGKGDELVATKQPYTGAKNQTVHTKLAQVINVLDFDGVVGDGVNDDTAGIQAAVDATPEGGTLNIPSGIFVLTDEIIIDKSITIKGPGGRILSDTLNGDCIIQKNSDKCIFRFRATANGYLFGQYGLTAVHFYDLNLIGPSNTSRSTYAFACDESVASGAYHFRGWSFNNINFRYFVYGFYLRGIIYLGCFNRVRGTRSNAFALIDNLAGSNDLCGQVRFHQCEGTFCDNGLMLSLESQTGDYGISQSTFSHGDRGIQFGWACHIDIGDDVSLEDNSDCGIYTIIPASVSNPNCEAAKNIRGIKFIGNGDDIWVNKETTAYAGGGFSWPMYIDGNTFAGTTRKILRITGNSPFDSQQFVFGVSNTYSGGLVPLSKIDSNFRGYNAIKEQGKTSVSANVAGTSDTNVATLTIPAGKSCIIAKYSAISLSTNASIGNTQYAAAVRFTDATNSIVLKDESGIVAGEDFVIASSGGSRVIVVSLRADAADHTAALSFTYKFY